MNPIVFAGGASMPVGRRRIAVSLALAGGVFLLTSLSAVRAQQWEDRSHRLWNERLTEAQIKSALARLQIGGEDASDPIRKKLREELQKEFPNLPSEFLDNTIKDALSNPKFIERVKELAKEKQTDPGRAPKLGPDDLAKLAKMMPRDTDPGKLPPGIKLPENWKTPPELKTPPEEKRPPGPTPPEPGTTFPPRAQPGPEPAPPPAPPQPGPPEGRPPFEPMRPPNLGQPAEPKSPEDALFRPADEPTDPRSKSLQAMAAVWERNFGSLDETPEVKRALFDLASNVNGLDLDLKDDHGNSIWDLLKKGDGSGFSPDDFLGEGGSWHLPKLEFPSFKLGDWFSRSSSSGSSSSSSSWWGRSSPRPPSSSSSGSGGFGGISFGGAWFPVIVLGIVALAILLWIVVKNMRIPATEVALVRDGLGPWPVDPRRINTREDVVKAFEYLSVLICGVSARMWTHNTIAESLAELAATHGETAAMLARLYELARYAPLDEPLTREEVMEARELVCGLAGVSY